MNLIGQFHNGTIQPRRAKILVRLVADLIPAGSKTILDIGSGDGLIGHLIAEARGVEVSGVDVLIRQDTHIPVTKFDGVTLPFADQTFDCCLFVDVLHHTENQMQLLHEALRVSRHGLVIKDHFQDGLLAYSTLRFMDYVGNAHEGVDLPYNYWTRERWKAAFVYLGVNVAAEKTNLHLYPWPINALCDRGLHFVAHVN